MIKTISTILNAMIVIPVCFLISRAGFKEVKIDININNARV
jgi:predicted glycosyltransferase involved in capsule biosynthesis|tara:strand:+ start:7945 stop:8067 length:123 start_codon:yes stop_codon:yes gene_type:complete